MTYTEHFGLSEPPFGATPDPRFIYPHSAYKEALATLQYGIEARKGFILISGEAGTGKTTLLRMLIRSLDPTTRTTLISNASFDFLELLRTILTDLQLPPLVDDRRVMMGQLNQFLIEELRQRRIVCLLVDNAHELSDELLEEIRLLSNLETDKVKLLQITLLGQPKLEARLERPELWQLKQRMVLRRRLQPLSSAEIESYVRSRLQTAGCGRRELFGADAIEAIAAYSHGIPGLINEICDKGLALACAADKKEVSAAVINEVARDLQLERAPQRTDESLPDTGKIEASKTAHETPDKVSLTEAWQLDPMHLRKRDRHRSVGGWSNLRSSPWIGVGMLLGVMSLASASLLFYSSEIGNSLWTLPGNPAAEGVHEQQLEASELAQPPLRPRISKEPVYFSGLANGGRVTEPVSLRAKATAKENYQKNDDPSPAQTNKRVQTSKQSIRRPENVEKETVPTPAGGLPSSAQTARPRAETKARKETREKLFEVVASSFVRDKPRSDADIIATLQPGTRVRLISQRGEYFEVSWLNHAVVRGYVHREDAFFEPVRIGLAPAGSRIDNRR